jgi:hypothetical protein
LRFIAGVFATGTLAITASAQVQRTPHSLPMTLSLPVGSPAENYLRYAQTLGVSRLEPWGLRPLTPGMMQSQADSGPFSRLVGAQRVRRQGDFVWQVLPVSATIWYNSTYPFGWNDGPAWRGRGATVAADGGVAARWKVLSVTLDPTGFISENRAFEMMPTGLATSIPYADPLNPTGIDRPQRFGDRRYGKLDWGQSTARADAFGIAVGASTANQWIGPMGEWPFLLGNNAAGIPHVFAGSSSPWNVGIGRIHGRLFYGDLRQSAFSNQPDSTGRRLTSGIMGVFMPRFLPGLEIGAGRMFEYRWPAKGFSSRDLRKPLEAFLKEHVVGDSTIPEPNSSQDNQLAALFARWVLPGSGFEAYGELGREDHSWNGRDAILEPDHSATYGLGVRKAWRSPDGALTGLRAEVLNMEISTLFRARSEGAIYAHAFTLQGHTHMGQVLGAGFAPLSGGGAMLGLERFLPNGQTSSISLTRMVIREREVNSSVEVQYALATDRTQRVGSVSVVYGLTAVYDMNRYFRADVGNVMLTLGLRW